MIDIEDIKKIVHESLEFNFVNNKKTIDREMKMFNLLISSFSDEEEYNYNEFCQLKLKLEVDSCNNIDINFKEIELSIMDEEIIKNRAIRKKMVDRYSNYEELLNEEVIILQLEKFFNIDKKLFYYINKYTTIGILRNKISDDIWNEKKEYFEDICDKRALKIAEDIAIKNQEKHKIELTESI